MERGKGGNRVETTAHAPEQKLPIEIGHVDRVHVNDVYIRESHERKVLEQFASEPTCAHDKDLDIVPDEINQLFIYSIMLISKYT